jgi:hypothetical protein
MAAAVLLASLATIAANGGRAGDEPVGKTVAAAPAGAQELALAQQVIPDACALLSAAEIAEVVGNPVGPGEHQAGPEVCRWARAQADDVSVLLTVRLRGSEREQLQCGLLRQGGDFDRPIPDRGDVALWRFSDTASVFNSGDLETCGPKGYVGLSLGGVRDIRSLQEAAQVLQAMVVERI